MKKMISNASALLVLLFAIVSCNSNPADSEAHKKLVADHATMEGEHTTLEKAHAAMESDHNKMLADLEAKHLKGEVTEAQIKTDHVDMKKKMI